MNIWSSSCFDSLKFVIALTGKNGAMRSKGSATLITKVFFLIISMTSISFTWFLNIKYDYIVYC